VISSPQAVLRQGPGKRDPRIRVVPRKTKVEVQEVMGEWIKIKVQDGTVGWMHESMLILPDD
jgi:SH3-like domain-containing protein